MAEHRAAGPARHVLGNGPSARQKQPWKIIAQWGCKLTSFRGSSRRLWRLGTAFLAALWVSMTWVVDVAASTPNGETSVQRAYLPLVSRPGACQPIPEEEFGSLSVSGPTTDRPAAQHGDLNLALRSFTPIAAHKGLVDYGGAADPAAPKLAELFPGRASPAVVGTYRVHEWDWSSNSPGGTIQDPEVTLVGLGAIPGETVRVPPSGYTVGDGFEALLLYADRERVTLKYTREDNVVHGFTLHLEGLCLEPRLLALYDAQNASGRTRLPAVREGRSLGRSASTEIGVAIRDHGRFLDPRSRKDWWQSLDLALGHR